MNWLEIVGWVGSMLFAFCALPQLILTVKQKHAKGLSWGFINMWAMGEILCFIYVFMQPQVQIPLLANYVLNFAMLCIIIYYKIVGSD